jgi:hypothetical protein
MRYRERDLRSESFGTMYYWLFSPPDYTYTTSVVRGVEERCLDDVGNFTGVNTFVKDTITKHYPLLNGEYRDPTTGDLVIKFTGFPISDRPAPLSPTYHWGDFSTADFNSFAWQILAETNPQTPHVSVPSVIGELKDLPSLVKGWGDTLLKAAFRGTTRGLPGLVRKSLGLAANANLTWRWVVRPMASDLRKLFDFVRAVNNRLDELYSLRENRVLKRRCHFGKAQAVTYDEALHWFHAGYGVLLQGPLKTTWTKEVWGTAQWKIAPDSQLPSKGAGELNQLARNLAFGLTSHEALAAAWELTPWSWLADWFGNVGDIIAATNNSVGLTWSKLCLMRHMFCHVDADINWSQSTPWVTLDSDYVLIWERKERWPVFPVIPFPLPNLPTLTGGQLSILASLAALRR